MGCNMNLVTHRSDNPKAYNRKKARKWSEDSMTVSSVFVGIAADARDVSLK